MRKTTNNEKLLNKLRDICPSQKNNGKIEGITTELLEIFAFALLGSVPNIRSAANGKQETSDNNAFSFGHGRNV